MSELVIAALVVAYVFALRSLSGARSDIRILRDEVDSQATRIAALTRRVFALETSQTIPSTPATPPPPPVYEPVRAPEAQPHTGAFEEGPASDFTPPPPPPPPFTAPAAPAEDWETVVGTNWLNRIGALVLVIGIALFLGYSLTQLGPAGKIAIGTVVGLAMLGTGVASERLERYRTYARSLIAGGWAILYFVAYAAHAIPAARIIESGAAGAAVLLLVSLAMIAHALRYRSQTATSLAALFAFMSLNLFELTSFSVVATLILAASLLGLATRLGWDRLAVVGAALTYFTFIARYDEGVYAQSGLLNGQAVLWIYWVLFEVTELLALRKDGVLKGFPLTPVNAFGFLLCSSVHGWERSDSQWAVFFCVTAAVYLVSSVLRERWFKATEAEPWQRAFVGYEGVATLCAALTAAAIGAGSQGTTTTAVLAIEGEAIIVLGLLWKRRFLQALGAAILILPLFTFLAYDVWGREFYTISAWKIHTWTPVALFLAGLFTANRILVPPRPAFSAAAFLLIAIVLHADMEYEWATLAWAVLAVCAYIAGLKFNKIDLRMQSYLGVIGAFIRAIAFNIVLVNSFEAHLAAALTAASFYVAEAFTARSKEQKEPWANWLFSILGTALTTVLLIDAIEGRLVTLALACQAAGLLTVGFVTRERVLRLSGLLLFLLCIGKLFAYDMRELDTLSRIASFVVLGLLLLGFSWIYTRFREKIRGLL